MDFEPADIFHSLKGKWTLNRTISSYGKIEGTATFKSDPNHKNCLHYKEEGIFFDNRGEIYTIFRAYDYQLNEGQISVFFTEIPKKLFYTLTFLDTSPLTATASYLCNCDVYDAIYTFTATDEFSLYYNVLGPKKNYSIQTNFKRLNND